MPLSHSVAVLLAISYTLYVACMEASQVAAEGKYGVVHLFVKQMCSHDPLHDTGRAVWSNPSISESSMCVDMKHTV